MKNLNTKALCKQIKASRNQMIWSLKDGEHTISDRRWAIKSKTLSPDVRVTLLSIFEGDMPEEGGCLHLQHGSILKNVAITTPEPEQGHVEYKRTKYVMDYEGAWKLRVFLNAENKAIYINEDFLGICDSRMQSFGSGNMRPLFYPEINYVVLPVRYVGENDLLSVMAAEPS